MAKYVLLKGTHAEGRAEDTTLLGIAKEQLKNGIIDETQFNVIKAKLRPRKVYYPVPGKNIIESKTDLTSMNGPYPMAPKFARADDPTMGAGHRVGGQMIDAGARLQESVPEGSDDLTPSDPFQGDTLDGMSVKELVKHAQAEGINIGEAKTKDAIIAAIRKAVQPT